MGAERDCASEVAAFVQGRSIEQDINHAALLEYLGNPSDQPQVPDATITFPENSTQEPLAKSYLDSNTMNRVIK